MIHSCLPHGSFVHARCWTSGRAGLGYIRHRRLARDRWCSQARAISGAPLRGGGDALRLTTHPKPSRCPPSPPTANGSPSRRLTTGARDLPHADHRRPTRPPHHTKAATLRSVAGSTTTGSSIVRPHSGSGSALLRTVDRSSMRTDEFRSRTPSRHSAQRRQDAGIHALRPLSWG